MPTPTIWYKFESTADLLVNHGSFGGEMDTQGGGAWPWSITDSSLCGVGNAAGTFPQDRYVRLFETISPTAYYNYLVGTDKPWSIALWYKTPADSGSEVREEIFVYGMANNQAHISLNYRNGTSYKKFWFDGSSIGAQTMSSAVAASTWVFVVATFDGTDFNWYLDGTTDLLSQGGAGGTVPYVSFCKVGPTWPFYNNGLMGDFKFYEEEIDLATVQQLYNDGLSCGIELENLIAEKVIIGG